MAADGGRHLGHLDLQTVDLVHDAIHLEDSRIILATQLTKLCLHLMVLGLRIADQIGNHKHLGLRLLVSIGSKAAEAFRAIDADIHCFGHGSARVGKVQVKGVELSAPLPYKVNVLFLRFLSPHGNGTLSLTCNPTVLISCRWKVSLNKTTRKQHI